MLVKRHPFFTKSPFCMKHIIDNAPVHEDLGEPDVADDGVDNERVFPRARHAVGMVALVEGDGLVGPV